MGTLRVKENALEKSGSTENFVGIDVAKAELVIHARPTNEHWTSAMTKPVSPS